MANRDDFLEPTKRALALRAGYHCSFEGCNRLTAGPSDESADAVAVVGMASHIHAAASGGRRYADSMSQAERRHIDNGIWLCNVHGTLIDRDEVTYTAEQLRLMKIAHERRISESVKLGREIPGVALNLVAIGPNIVCTGELIGSEGNTWELRLEHFVCGNLTSLIDFGSTFDALPIEDRFVLANELGDGRVLSTPPSWKKAAGGIVLRCSTEPSFPRILAQNLGADLALGPDGDLMPDLSMVSGVDGLAQRVRLVLWHQRGQNHFDKRFGTRIAEYFSLLGSSVWFEQLVRLEAIRMAAIPFPDEFTGDATPFLCVERVEGLELLSDRTSEGLMKARIRLAVSGVGQWSTELELYIPDYPYPERTLTPEMEALLA